MIQVLRVPCDLQEVSIYASPGPPSPFYILLSGRTLVQPDSRIHSDSSFHPKLRAFQGVRLYTESAPTPTTFPYGEAHACSFPHFGYDAQGDKTISFTVLIQRECSFTETHPWVMKCGVNIPTHTYTDCNIVDRLCDKGFNANEILKFLQEKKV